MVLFVEDEVKINPITMHKFFFGDINNIKSIYRKKGVIIEVDFDKKKKVFTYFVEFNKKFEHRYWFLVEELILV